MIESGTFRQEFSAETDQDRRRERRAPLAFPIYVCGIDETGHFFSEDTSTSNLSAQGCCFLIRRKPEQGDVMALRMASRNVANQASRRLLFEVRWTEPRGDGWLVGMACLQTQNLWTLAFPPPVS